MLKKLLLLSLFLLFITPLAVFAQQENLHENEYFKVKLPTFWEIQADTGKPPVWRIFSYNETYKIFVSPAPKNQQTIDEYVDSLKQKINSYNSQFNMPGIGIQLEESTKLQINNRDARCLLYSFNFPPKKDYRLIYIIYGNDYRYNISAEGAYDTLKNDRKIIIEIVSSIEILK